MSEKPMVNHARLEALGNFLNRIASKHSFTDEVRGQLRREADYLYALVVPEPVAALERDQWRKAYYETRDALVKYGKHRGDCNYLKRVPFGAKAREEHFQLGCTCGFTAAAHTNPYRRTTGE